MKAKLFLIFVLSLLSLPSFSQLKDGKYKVIGYRTLIDGKTIDENPFTCEAILRITDSCKIAVFRIDGYIVSTFLLEPVLIKDGNYIYRGTDYMTNAPTTLVFIPEKEHGLKDSGLLMYMKSSSQTDCFAIKKEE